MIHLKDNWKKASLIGVFIFFSVVLIILVLPQMESEREETIKYASLTYLGVERGMDFPPAFFWGEDEELHYLGLKPGRVGELKYLSFNSSLEITREKKIGLDENIQVEYLFPVGFQEGEVIFGLVSREQGSNRTYLVFPAEEEGNLVPMGLTISRHHDIAAKVSGGEVFYTYVEREGQEYRLWLEKRGEEPFLVLRSQGLICLPRFIIDDNNILHLQWKGTRNDRGISQYQAVCLEEMKTKNEEPLELGFASYYFGEGNGHQRYYSEDPGADFLVDKDGSVYITWTDSVWDKEMNIMRSTLELARINDSGEKDGKWRIPGSSLPLFGNLFLNEKREVALVWEDYFGRQFNLMYTYRDSERDIFVEPERVQEAYASKRLVRVENNTSGDFVLMGREVDGSIDKIWAISSQKLGTSQWYHGWNLWFLEDGIGSIIVEGSLIVLYSLISSLIMIARNTLSLVFIGLMLYLLQKTRVLGKVNLFQFLGVLIILIALFREYIPLFYNTPPVDFGFMLFSGVFATAVVLWVSRDNWFKGGEEFLYLYYSLVWIFSDTFLMYLALTPTSFMP